MLLSTTKHNNECCATMLLWQIYVTGNNAHYTYQFLNKSFSKCFAPFHKLHMKAALKQNNDLFFMAFVRHTAV